MDDSLAVGKPDWLVFARRLGGRRSGTGGPEAHDAPAPVSLAVEVKDTVADRWRYRDLSKAQAERMDLLVAQGVEGYLLVRTPGGVFLVPWGNIAEAWWADHLGKRRGDVDLATVGLAVEGADWLGVALGG